LFQVGLAILYLNQNRLLSAEDSEAVTQCLKEFAYDTEELINVFYFSQQIFSTVSSLLRRSFVVVVVVVVVVL
jgi:hypothetical protein